MPLGTASARGHRRRIPLADATHAVECAHLARRIGTRGHFCRSCAFGQSYIALADSVRVVTDKASHVSDLLQ